MSGGPAALFPYPSGRERSATSFSSPSVANAVDDLRQVVARVDALANAAENLFDGVFWVSHGVDSIKFDRLAHLVSATTDAVQAAMEAGGWLAVELSTRRTGA